MAVTNKQPWIKFGHLLTRLLTLSPTLLGSNMHALLVNFLSYSIHPILTHKISGIMDPLPNNVNAYNALLDPSSGYPTALGYYYFG